MTSKPLFQPAPRPRPLNDPASTEALKEATRDLGFDRPSSGAPAEAASVAPPAPVSAPAPAPEPARVAVADAPRAVPKTKAVKPPIPVVEPDEPMTSLRLDIDVGLSTALKLDAVRRRVTVKYLILELLAEKGYPIAMANLAPDGRRLRK